MPYIGILHQGFEGGVEEWAVFHGLTTEVFGRVLLDFRGGPLVARPQAGPWHEATATEVGGRGEGQAPLHCEATGKEESR